MALLLKKWLLWLWIVGKSLVGCDCSYRRSSVERAAVVTDVDETNDARSSMLALHVRSPANTVEESSRIRNH